MLSKLGLKKNYIYIYIVVVASAYHQMKWTLN